MNESTRSTIPMPVYDNLCYMQLPDFRRRPNLVPPEFTTDTPNSQDATGGSERFVPISPWRWPFSWEYDSYSKIYADQEHAALHVPDDFGDAVVERSFQFDVKPEGSATSSFDEHLLNQSKEVLSEVTELFSYAESIKIEAGMENYLSVGLKHIITEYGEIALGHIEAIILNENQSASLAREALKYIGSIETFHRRNKRRELLERCLRLSRYAWIRDGAGLGISFLDDPQSIPVLKEAIVEESNLELKEDLIQVLEQLEETRLESS